MLSNNYVLRSAKPSSSSTRFAASVFALAAAMLLFSFAPIDARAQKSKRVRADNVSYGRIEITTSPGGYPVLIDGKPSGVTSTTVRYLELEPGRRTVEIQFPNNTRWAHTFDIVAGRRDCINLNYRPRTLEIPLAAQSPCPYNVEVSAPMSVNDGDIITFTSNVGYNGTGQLNYVWTVSPASARVTNGAGTPTVTVDSTGLGNNRVTAILTVEDGSGDLACRQSAQASTAVTAPPPSIVERRRFDEFPSITFDDDKARFDNFAIELQNDPTARGVLIVYQGARSRAGQAERLGTRAIKYLTTERGIDPNRLVRVNGGVRERDYIELYVVPPGAELPQATPTDVDGGGNAQPTQAAPYRRTHRARRN